MRLHSLLLLGLCACETAQAHWWQWEHTVYIERIHTVTKTKTAKCSSFGTSTTSTRHCTTTTSSMHPISSSHTPSSSLHTTSSSTHTSSSSSRHTSASLSTYRTSSSTRPSSSHTTSSSSRTTSSAVVASSHTSSPSSSHSTPSSSHSTSHTTSTRSSTHSTSTSASSSHHNSPTSSGTSPSVTLPSISLPISIPTSIPTSSSSSPPAPSVSPFLIQAITPTDDVTNQQYAVIATDGSLTFTTNDPSSASTFTTDTAGHLISGGLYAQITTTTAGVSEVQFLNAATTLSKRQTPGTTTPLTCTVTADPTGAPALVCTAGAQTISQACGTSFYLGASSECQPLLLQTYDPALATTTPGSGFGPGTGDASPTFELQYNTLTNTNGFYAAYTAYQGATVLAFANYGHGAPFSLDAYGHLVSVGPTASGAVVAYAAVFAIGSTFGPVVEQTGVVPAGYVAIECTIEAAAGAAATASLSCVDGADGTNTVLQICESDLLYLGTALGAGCAVPVLGVVYTS